MKEILLNLANIDLINFCKRENIDCSGTYVVKNGWSYNFSLVKEDTGRAIVTVHFTKNSVPTFLVHA